MRDLSVSNNTVDTPDGVVFGISTTLNPISLEKCSEEFITKHKVIALNNLLDLLRTDIANNSKSVCVSQDRNYISVIPILPTDVVKTYEIQYCFTNSFSKFNTPKNKNLIFCKASICV